MKRRTFTWPTAATENLAVKAVRATGLVTLNGAAPPPTTAPGRALLTFDNVDTGREIRVTVPSSGAATYSQCLAAGSYDVFLETGDEGGFPQPRMKLKTMTLTTDATENLDV